MKTVESVSIDDPGDPGDALLAAARELFVAEGLNGLSLRRVAERAGSTTMTVYTRFGSKDGLVGALFDEGFERLREAQEAVDASQPPVERVLALCEAYRRTAQAYPHHYALMLGGTSGVFNPSSVSLERSLATFSTLVDAVEATRPKGRARKDRASSIANRLLAFCHGWVSLELRGFFEGRDSDPNNAFRCAVAALLSSER